LETLIDALHQPKVNKMKFVSLRDLETVSGFINYELFIPNKGYPIRVLIAAVDNQFAPSNKLTIIAREADNNLHDNGKIIYERSNIPTSGKWTIIDLQTTKSFILIAVASELGGQPISATVAYITNEQATK